MDDSAVKTSTETLFFVGIASSAGGLEAVTALVQNLPEAANAVYILAQHMSPTHKSLLSALISRETPLKVVELEDEAIPEPDTIYVPPPNFDVVLEEDKLRLRDPRGHSASPKPSADRLFKTLAETCGERSVAVVLSGTGSDGSYGVRAVREVGGVTIAQDTTTAKYDGMPSAAIETGCVDLTLTPEEIGQHLNKILASPRDLSSLRRINVSNSRLDDLMQIIMAHTRMDFRDYKENTINRRISRRMFALGIDDYEEYVAFCRESADEVEALHRDLLISVTRFFRDPDQFQQLRRVIEEMVEQRKTHESRPADQFRVWVAGCATGEEAYSIAILLAEALGGPEMLKRAKIQIFATDIDENAIDVGRRGVYPAAAVSDIPIEYVDKYFEMSGGRLQVIAALRGVVLFSLHNVSQDPPFLNVDLVSLRNILIYFNTTLQERVLRRLHYAMAHDAVLFLGTSENIGSMQAYFEARLDTDKIFTKRLTKPDHAFALDNQAGMLAVRRTRMTSSAGNEARSTAELDMFEALARSVAPNGFVTTRSGSIVRVFGDISNVVQLSEDSALNLSTRILRHGIRDEASSLITVVLKSKEPRSGRWHELPNGSTDRLRLRAYPIISEIGGGEHVLFAVQIRTAEEKQPRLEELTDADRAKYARQLEQEMLSTRETLQQTVEELQTSNEELQSVNEELQSTNEELQATNEELETSNEELQSTNEELITVNEEMQVNQAEVQRVTVELASIVKHSPYPIVVIDHALMVRRMSDSAKAFFDLQDVPVHGLHAGQLRVPGDFMGFAALCTDAFRERTEKSVQIEHDGQLFSVLVTPFSGSQNSVLGLKITVVELEVASYKAMAEAMDDLGGLGHWRFNLESGQVFWSKEVFRMHGQQASKEMPSLDEALGFYHQSDRKYVTNEITRAMKTGEAMSFEARLVQPGGTIVPVRVGGRTVGGLDGTPSHLVGAIIDLRKEVEQRVLAHQFQDVQDELNLGFYSYDVETDTPFWNRQLHEMLGFDPDTHEPAAPSAMTIFHPDDAERVAQYMRKAVEEGSSFDYEARLMHTDGRVFPCRGSARPLTGDDGRVTHVYGFFQLLEDEATARTVK